MGFTAEARCDYPIAGRETPGLGHHNIAATLTHRGAMTVSARALGCGSAAYAAFRAMWIQTTNTDSAGEPVTRSVRVTVAPDDDDEDPTVLEAEFSPNGKAQVTADVGEELIRRFDTIVPSDGDDHSDDAEADAEASNSPRESVEGEGEGDGSDSG